MGVLHFREIEIFFPVRPFFLERGGTVADFYPADGLVDAEPRFTHVAQVFTFCDRAPAERFLLDGLQQISFAAGFNTGSN
jgi:hypothetical protein